MAISILLVVVTGPMTVAQKGIKNAYFANEQVTAVFLAQEAIEAVRALRDVQALDVYDGGGQTDGWVTAECRNGCAYVGANNALDPFDDCVNHSNCRLEINERGEYLHSIIGGVDSPFTRIVTIGAAVGGGVPVTVEVSWNSNLLGEKSLRLQTWIYDHYQRFEN